MLYHYIFKSSECDHQYQSASKAYSIPLLTKTVDSGQTGSYLYMAPEVNRCDKYNQTSDVFSFGTILYEVFSQSLLAQTFAFSKSDMKEYANKVATGFRPEIPNHVSPEIVEVIEMCWRHDPVGRPGIDLVLDKLVALTSHAPFNSHFKNHVCLMM